MSILIDKDTRLIIQGLTGREGTFHGQRMIEYGTKVVAGVTPGKGGQKVFGVPVYDTVREAKEATGADATAIFVPAKFTSGAALEAIDAGIELIITILRYMIC
jgi:succinyl-CoA synthetase alpha subunit